MANILGEKMIEINNKYKENKLNDESFLDYYARYLEEHFYIEKMNPSEILNFIDGKLDKIAKLDSSKQNEEIENLISNIQQYFKEKELLKPETSFEALEFLALTLIGRIQ